MDWLATVLTSGNFFQIACFVLLLIFICAYFSKKGLINIRGKNIQIGNSENERRIIRQQVEHVRAKLDGYFAVMINANKNNPEFVEWRCQMSKELVYDVFIEAICLNHITDDDFYCKGKTAKMWAEIQKLQLSQKFTTPEFKKEIFDFCREVFKNLMAIRKYYEEKGL